MTERKTLKPRRSKSPAVPSRSLELCRSDIVRLYESFAHASFGKSEIASAFRVSSNSGSFSKRLFSLKEFGLLDGSMDTFRVSDPGKSFIKATLGSGELKSLGLDALRGSAVFNSLLNSFKSKLPDSDVVTNRLEGQYKFNPKTAKVTAQVLEDSLRFIGALDDRNNILPVRPDEASRTSIYEDREAPSEPSDEREEATEQGQLLKFQMPLEEDRMVTILYPRDLKDHEAERVGKALLLLPVSDQQGPS